MKSIKSITIYYFSGTGNSRNVALWLSEIATENASKVNLINIAEIDRKNIEKPEADSLLIFISPVHGFNYPPIMLNFIAHFPKGNNNIVLMNTRAGMLIGKYITPGVNGIAFYLSSILLLIKGYSIQALFPVNLPSNWISIHPGLNKKTITFIHEKEKVRVRNFGKKIIMGKKNFFTLLEFYDLLLMPISILYYLIGRFILAKTFYASSLCNNCNLCIQSCPVKAIIAVNERPFWTFKCESCMKCMSNCPRKAIETGHGTIAIFAILFSLFVLTPFYQFMEMNFYKPENEFLKLIIESILFLLFFSVWYRLMHYALKIKYLERIIVYTSLTKYAFWGKRYKAIKEKQLGTENKRRDYA